MRSGIAPEIGRWTGVYIIYHRGNECFSAIGHFLDQNSIDYESFTWA